MSADERSIDCDRRLANNGSGFFQRILQPRVGFRYKFSGLKMVKIISSLRTARLRSSVSIRG
jgi:hypothetical protein